MTESAQDSSNTSLYHLWHRIADITVGRLISVGALIVSAIVVLAICAFVWFVLWPAHGVPPLEPVDEYVYLNQGWGQERGATDRQTYYYTGQGTMLPQGEARYPLRYSWFIHLEQPLSKERFADPDHMRAWRFIVDAQATKSNPHQLPVGFARHFNPTIGEDVLDLTCAACHTGQIHYKKGDTQYAIRIDGGQAMHAFTDMKRGSFGPTLLASLTATSLNPLKFNRFARNVLGQHYPQGKDQLKRELRATIKAFATMGQNNPLRNLYPIQEGYGRTDALGRIANTVFGDHLVPGNYHQGGAPVSYPYLWNIWKFDWVQYNGSVAQPLARNVGEAMGVGAVVNLTDVNGGPIPADERYTSSVRIADLVTIERTLQRLTPPTWPEEILGTVDRVKATHGEQLFKQHCQGCHGPHVANKAKQQALAPGKRGPDDLWSIEVIPIEHIGTDATAADGFVNNRYDLSAAGITDDEVRKLLKPLQVRALARDVRYRLHEVVDALKAKGQDAGQLAVLLASFPDPDASRVIDLPEDAFEKINAELARVFKYLPKIPEVGQPPTPWTCDLDCHTQWLLWDIRKGSTHIISQLDTIDVSRVSEGEGLNIIGLMIKNKFYQDYGISYAEQACIEGFGTLDLPQVIDGYKPRPLQGVWATPPFLHNGSVPNIYQMLLPPEERDSRFFVGRRDYDPKHLGFITQPLFDHERDGFWLDTSIKGNHNTGHAFAASPKQWQQHQSNPKEHPLPSGTIGPLLSNEERFALIEYLKVHQDQHSEASPIAAPDCNIWTAAS